MPRACCASRWRTPGLPWPGFEGRKIELVTAFAREADFAAAVELLDRAGLPYRVVRPDPAYRLVGAPAIEIFRRLPGTNCGCCGEQSCLAFAVKVHGAEAPVYRCRPVFAGEAAHLKDALLEACAGVGA